MYWPLKDPYRVLQQNCHNMCSYEFLNKEECEFLIRFGKSLKIEDANVVINNEFVIDESIRKTRVSWLEPSPQTEWIYKKISNVVETINQEWFNFDLEFIEPLQFTQYNDDNCFYGRHLDIGSKLINNCVRKLSFSIQLSDSADYVGGDLLIHTNDVGVLADRKQGNITAFSSATLHEVTPVTKGTRYSLVGWVFGKPFR